MILKKGVVYLAIDADVAYSYAELGPDENEDIPESWIEKNNYIGN